MIGRTKAALRLRHMKDQILWSSTGTTHVADPTGYYAVAFGDGGTMIQTQSITTPDAYEFTGAEFLGPIENPGGRASYCLLTFAGEVEAATSFVNALYSPLVVTGVGIPASGPSITDQDDFGDTQREGIQLQLTEVPVGSPSAVVHGGFPNIFQGFSGSNKFPVNSNLLHGCMNTFLYQSSHQPVAGDEFHVMTALGKVNGGYPSIAGLEKIYPLFQWVFGQDAPIGNSITLSGNIVASLFEVSSVG